MGGGHGERRERQPGAERAIPAKPKDRFSKRRGCMVSRADRGRDGTPPEVPVARGCLKLAG